MEDCVDKRLVRRDDVARSLWVAIWDVEDAREVDVVDIEYERFVGVFRDDHNCGWCQDRTFVCPVCEIFYAVILSCGLPIEMMTMMISCVSCFLCLLLFTSGASCTCILS